MSSMDFDLNQFDDELARYAVTRTEDGGNSANFGTQELSRMIATAIVQLLPQLNSETPRAHLDKISDLCSNAVELSPNKSARRILQGQFYLQIRDFKRATVSFIEAYNIEKDVEAYKWPHLPKTEGNASLLVLMGNALYHAGDEDMAKMFFDVGREWSETMPVQDNEER